MRRSGATTKSRAKLGRPASTVAADHRRRSLLPHSDTVPERALRAQILERDAWTCGICTEPIDPDVKYPDRRSASTDHIVPVSAGGGHVIENMQAAHLDCNMRKGKRVT